ncbi:hypothetical protein H0X10_00505 [Candidatus Saccharibacteria bacterium]|nr:hypothetical protein [Candidatus Saccharibacteria bacterium]
MYGPVLGASTTTVAALALPNTGSNKLLEAVVLTALVAGIVITIISVARVMAAKANV